MATWSEADKLRAMTLYEKLQELCTNRNLVAFDVGECFSALHQGKLFMALEFKTFGDLANAAGCSLSTASHLMSNYRRFVEKLQVPREKLSSLEWSKASLIGQVATKGNVLKWIDRAKRLTLEKLRGAVRDRKSVV